MGYKLSSLVLEYKVGDTVVSDIITSSMDRSVLQSIQNILQQEVLILKKDLQVKLAVLKGRYHDLLYTNNTITLTPEKTIKTSTYYNELNSIESSLLIKYNTIGKYFKSKDISKFSKTHSFKIIQIKESEGVY